MNLPIAPPAPLRKSALSAELRRMISLLAPYRGKIILSFVAMIFACLGLLALPLVTREMLGNAIHLRKVIFSPGLAFAVIGGFLLLAVSGYASSVLLFQVAHELTARLRSDYLRQLLFAPIGYHRNASTGQLLERLAGCLADVDWFIRRAFGSLLGVVILMTGGVAMMCYLNWKLALFSACVTPVMALGMRSLNDRSRKLQGQRMDAQESLVASMHGSLTGIEVVKVFGAEAREHRRFEGRQDGLLAVQRTESRVAALMEPLFIAGACLAFIVVLFYGSYLIAHGKLAPEELITFFVYLVYVVPNSRNLAQQLAQWRIVNVALDRLAEIASIVPERDGTEAAPLPQPVRGEVEFSQVSYGYQEREQVLRDLSFRLRAGERVGIVGESGAGKSTIFNLLLRFYAPDAGRILVDGRDLQATALRSLREAVAIVPQDNLLFEDTILENVRYGNPSASDAEVQAACRAARAASFIESLPAGYLTQVGERGLKLSGGQRQRLAIARAFLKDSPILLMDEATSSLDAGTESELRAVMEELMRDRTTLVIAHRLSTVTHLPRILMVSQGRILDDGSPEELYERCPAYRTFVSTQLIQQ